MLNEPLKLRTYPHKDLSTVCEKVGEAEFCTFELDILCGKLLTTMRAFAGVGLAANQVGIHKRIFAFEKHATDNIDRKQFIDDIPEIIINPEVITDDCEDSKYKEGCLSFPGSYVQVTRPTGFTLHYRDTSGQHLTLGPDICCGIFGHVFLHEIDHLNGLTVMDHASFIDKNKITKKVNKLRGIR